MKHLLIILSVIFSLLRTNAQTPYIGQEAESVKTIIEFNTNQHNQEDSYGNTSSSIWSSDVLYEDGKIKEVILCCNNEPIINWQITTDFCKSYVMKDGKLDCIQTQYKELSVTQLKSFLEKQYPYDKKKNRYYVEDSVYYDRVYLGSNGLAAIEFGIANNKLLLEHKKNAKFQNDELIRLYNRKQDSLKILDSTVEIEIKELSRKYNTFKFIDTLRIIKKGEYKIQTPPDSLFKTIKIKSGNKFEVRTEFTIITDSNYLKWFDYKMKKFLDYQMCSGACKLRGQKNGSIYLMDISINKRNNTITIVHIVNITDGKSEDILPYMIPPLDKEKGKKGIDINEYQ